MRRFRYILIDEYQDTNRIQYLLSRSLVAGQKNVCAVGDDDQSIYRFRGADVGNILHFERDFSGAKRIALERNYRCTEPILAVANAVMERATNRLRTGVRRVFYEYNFLRPHQALQYRTPAEVFFATTKKKGR